MRTATFFIGCLLTVASLASLPADEKSAQKKSAPENTQQSSGGEDPSAEGDHATESLRGRVVWMDEAVQRLYDVQTDADVKHTQVALETKEKTLVPLMKDARGRGFHLDKRLRGIDMELFVRRYEGCPSVQVIRTYSLKEGKKYLLDYWCDICAIPMFELKECECCQGPIRIRERLVTKDGVQPEE